MEDKNTTETADAKAICRDGFEFDYCQDCSSFEDCLRALGEDD